VEGAAAAAAAAAGSRKEKKKKKRKKIKTEMLYPRAKKRDLREVPELVQ
jgi:hypothetical protein